MIKKYANISDTAHVQYNANNLWVKVVVFKLQKHISKHNLSLFHNENPLYNNLTKSLQFHLNNILCH